MKGRVLVDNNDSEQEEWVRALLSNHAWQRATEN